MADDRRTGQGGGGAGRRDQDNNKDNRDNRDSQNKDPTPTRARIAPLATPFAGETDDAWESELAAWDAAIPIVTPGAPKAPRLDRPVVPALPTGAVPEEENAFFETPTTVISQGHPALPFEDPSEAIPGAAFDSGVAPASGSYAVLVANDDTAPSIFDREPAPEERPSFPQETLVEMTAGPWSQDIGRMILLGDGPDPKQPERAYFETFAQLIAEERALESDRERIVGLCLAAARVAELLGHPKPAREHVEAALAADVAPLASAASAAAHRARLGLAERMGRVDDEGAAESLARLALISHPDQSYYRALLAEWTLARAARGVADATAAAMITATPVGLARMLAEAEMARREPSLAAAILETAAHRVGGGLGAGLLVFAAELNEIASDFQSAAEQRFMAARLDDHKHPAAALVGLIRDVARLEADAVVAAIEQLIQRFPPSSLKVALARWGAALARRAQDRDRAWRFVVAGSALGPLSAGLARDRLDLRPVRPADGMGSSPSPSPSPGPITGAEIDSLLASVARFWSSPFARARLALRACELATDTAGVTRALDAVQRVRSETPVLAGLGPAIEELASRVGDPQARLRALRLWRQVDQGREIPALLELADQLAQVSDDSSEAARAEALDAVEAVLGELATLAPESPAFWRHAALAAGRGRFADAAARMDQGLRDATWRDSALAVPLGEIAAELVARENLGEAAARLLAPAARDGLTPASRQTVERILRRLGDRTRFAAYARTAAAEPEDRARRAELLLETVFAGGDSSSASDAIPLVVSETLDLVPLHPAALGLSLGTSPSGATLSEYFATGSSGAGGRRWTLVAAVAAGAAGDSRQALALARDAHRGPPRDQPLDADNAGPPRAVTGPVPDTGAGTAGDAGDRDLTWASRAAVRRFVWAASDAEERARILASLATSGAGADLVVEAAEADEQMGEGAAATNLFEQALQMREADVVAADARMGLARLSRFPPFSSMTAPDPVSAAGVVSADRVVRLEMATRAGRWDDVVQCLIDAPPHEEIPTAPLLLLAAEIEDGRTAGGRSTDLWARARATLGAVAHWGRAADPNDARPLEIGAALEQLAAATARAGDERSAALFLVEAANLAEKGGDADLSATVERRLRSAIAHDPTSAPAAMAWRRWLVRSGRIGEAAEASAAEAEALIDPALRLRTLLRAEALLGAVSDQTVSPPSPTAAEPTASQAGMLDADRLGRASHFLRRALEIAPHAHEPFKRLRDLYEAAGSHTALVDLLASRRAVTKNPFEATALRLARAEIFAGSLHDRERAKAELEAILQKEPQHARALGRLADFEEEDEHHAAAADLLMRRAHAERSPEKLRELFLRLGRIYTQRVPDPKRAVGAYVRVVQLDANNREALDELSRLYFDLGETKNAMAATERLLRIEQGPARRAAYLVRLGQLAERASDPRAASSHFRRAVEEAPSDIEALGELVRYLDKTRDASGRRLVLDRAAGDLRAAVIADPGDLRALRALAAVCRWRGRSAVAAAAAELEALSGGSDSGGIRALPEWATPPLGGHRLAALANAAVDEKTFGATVPSSVRHLFRLLGPVLWEGGRADPSRFGVDRGDRISPNQPPRDMFDAVAAELGAGPFELYVCPARSPGDSPLLLVEPGKPPAILIDASLVKLGSHALRFMAGRTLRLVSTHLDVAEAGGVADLGAWLGGVIRQFVADYSHPEVREEVTAARAARVAKLLPKKLRQDLMPFAMESSGPLDLAALRMGIREGINRVGLVASGSLGASLRVLRAVNAKAGEGLIPWADAIKGDTEALALLTFALSDDYDDLIRSLKPGP